MFCIAATLLLSGFTPGVWSKKLISLRFNCKLSLLNTMPFCLARSIGWLDFYHVPLL